MLRSREFSSHVRRYPRDTARPQWRRTGFRTPLLGLRNRFRRLGEPRVGFQVGLRHPVAKIAVAAFVLLDVILVYRLTAGDSPALITGVSEGGGVHTASRTTFDELREALADLNVRVSALKLFGDAGRGTHDSTNQSGGGTSQVTSTSGGSPTGSGGSTSGSESGSSSTGSGSGGSTDGGSTGGGGGGGSAGGGGTDDGGGSGGGGGGGGP